MAEISTTTKFEVAQFYHFSHRTIIFVLTLDVANYHFELQIENRFCSFLM